MLHHGDGLKSVWVLRPHSLPASSHSTHTIWRRAKLDMCTPQWHTFTPHRNGADYPQFPRFPYRASCPRPHVHGHANGNRAGAPVADGPGTKHARRVFPTGLERDMHEGSHETCTKDSPGEPSIRRRRDSSRPGTRHLVTHHHACPPFGGQAAMLATTVSVSGITVDMRMTGSSTAEKSESHTRNAARTRGANTSTVGSNENVGIVSGVQEKDEVLTMPTTNRRGH